MSMEFDISKEKCFQNTIFHIPWTYLDNYSMKKYIIETKSVMNTKIIFQWPLAILYGDIISKEYYYVAI